MKDPKAKAFLSAFRAFFTKEDKEEEEDTERNDDIDATDDNKDEENMHVILFDGWFFKRIGCEILCAHLSLIFCQIQIFLLMLSCCLVLSKFYILGLLLTLGIPWYKIARPFRMEGKSLNGTLVHVLVYSLVSLTYIPL
jgi:hypothetical protein